MFLVGKVIGTHGIKGEIKVKSDTSFDRYQKGSVLYIGDEKKNKKIVIDTHRNHQGFDLITFNGITDINLVLEYVGQEIYVKDHEKRSDTDKVYYEDLIGCKVIDEDNNECGIVQDLVEVPQGVLLEIVNGKNKSLVPYVKEFVKNVDKENKVILLHLIEGLL